MPGCFGSGGAARGANPPSAAADGAAAARARCARGAGAFRSAPRCSARRWRRPGRTAAQRGLAAGGRAPAAPERARVEESTAAPVRGPSAGRTAAPAAAPAAAADLLRRVLQARSPLVASVGEVDVQLRAVQAILPRRALEAAEAAWPAVTRGAPAPQPEALAIFGVLAFVRGLLMQQLGPDAGAGAAFAHAGPPLGLAVGSGVAGDFAEAATRCLVTCLVFAREFESACRWGEVGASRYRSAGMLRLYGEVCNVRGQRLDEQESRLRTLWFRRAAAAFREAHDIEPGPRRAYISWAFALSMLEEVEEGRAVAARALAHCTGFWVDKLQRPNHMVPGLDSRPWHDPADFPWVKRLESRWQAILAELEALEADGGGSAHWPEVRGHDRTLAHGTGVWRLRPLLGMGEEEEELARRSCPITVALLAEVEAVMAHRDHRPEEETALFSRLTPGTHLRAHCGPTNTHLTCHLGLRVPDGCRIRVGQETRRWEEGRCLVFDDSWEHEVWHEGRGTRVVLLVRFWHPGVPPSHREALLRDEARDRQSKAWTLL